MSLMSRLISLTETTEEEAIKKTLMKLGLEFHPYKNTVWWFTDRGVDPDKPVVVIDTKAKVISLVSSASFLRQLHKKGYTLHPNFAPPGHISRKFGEIVSLDYTEQPVRKLIRLLPIWRNLLHEYVAGFRNDTRPVMTALEPLKDYLEDVARQANLEVETAIRSSRVWFSLKERMSSISQFRIFVYPDDKEVVLQFMCGFGACRRFKTEPFKGRSPLVRKKFSSVEKTRWDSKNTRVFIKFKEDTPLETIAKDLVEMLKLARNPND